MQAAQRVRLVDAAVAEGRILASRRSFWLRHLVQAPHDATLLASLAASPNPPGVWPLT